MANQAGTLNATKAHVSTRWCQIYSATFKSKAFWWTEAEVLEPNRNKHPPPIVCLNCYPPLATAHSHCTKATEIFLLEFLMSGGDQIKAFNQHKTHSELLSMNYVRCQESLTNLHTRRKGIMGEGNIFVSKNEIIILACYQLWPSLNKHFFTSSYYWVTWSLAGTVITSFSAECFRNLKPPTLSPCECSRFLNNH